MLQFVVGRVIWSVVLFLVLTFATFCLFFMIPSDPLRATRSSETEGLTIKNLYAFDCVNEAGSDGAAACSRTTVVCLSSLPSAAAPPSTMMPPAIAATASSTARRVRRVRCTPSF